MSKVTGFGGRQVAEEQGIDLVELSADIVSAYVTNNAVSPAALTELLATVFGALSELIDPSTRAASELPKSLASPAAVKKSITPDHLISFEDGKRYRSLKRHLATRGLTPEEYRSKWGLPSNYPMAAPNYSAARSELAKRIGLGKKSGKR